MCVEMNIAADGIESMVPSEEMILRSLQCPRTVTTMRLADDNRRRAPQEGNAVRARRRHLDQCRVRTAIQFLGLTTPVVGGSTSVCAT